MNSGFLAKSEMAAEALMTAVNWAKHNRLSPPPGAKTTEMGRLLWKDPQPLIHPDARLLVVFSQKSACTNVLIWFFHQLGYTHAARHFHHWPHEYRNIVYYYSEMYRKAYDLDFSTFKVVRVIRDPYERAVSSFRHVVRFPFADSAVRWRTGYRHTASKGLSLSTFLDFLERTDLTACDPHFSIQRHPIEDRLPVHYLINISKENLFERLKQVEADLGLRPLDDAALQWIDYLKSHNRPELEFRDDSDIYTRLFTREQARYGPWPSNEALLTPAARERIGKLYATDIKAYL